MSSYDHRRRCGAMFKGDDSGGSSTGEKMPLVFVKARSEHIPDIVRLNGVVQQLHAELSPDIFRADWVSSDLQVFWCDRLDHDNSEIVIAVLDGRSVGYIWFEIQNREGDALHMHRCRVYVHHIAVDECARGAGVGSRLLERAELAAKEARICNVVLDAWASNSPAQSFFAARGYSPINIVLGKTLTES